MSPILRQNCLNYFKLSSKGRSVNIIVEDYVRDANGLNSPTFSVCVKEENIHTFFHTL